MNTRVQVEHPVTEMITGIDIVRQQLLIASDEKVGYSQEQVEIRGHAIECRINAENSETFIPCPGTIDQFHAPGGPGVGMDTHIYNGYKVPPNYDSMNAKIITTDQKRQETIKKIRRALDEFVIEGIKTTIPFHRKLMDNEDYLKGVYTTKFMDDFEF